MPETIQTPLFLIGFLSCVVSVSPPHSLLGLLVPTLFLGLVEVHISLRAARSYLPTDRGLQVALQEMNARTTMTSTKSDIIALLMPEPCSSFLGKTQFFALNAIESPKC